MTQTATINETRRAGAECRHCHSRNTVQVAQVSDRVNHELWVRSECRDCGRSTETRFGCAAREATRMKLTAANVTRTLKNAGYEHEPKAYQAGFRTVTFKRNGGDVTILRRGCPVALHSYAHTLRAEGFTCEVDVDNNAVYVTA